MTNEYQSLHDAMKTYDGGTYDYECEDCTDQETWDNKNLTNTQAYADNDPENYIDAWDPANTGGDGTENNIAGPQNLEVDTNGNPDQEDVFEGGFSGNCPDGQAWQQDEGDDDNSEWACSDAVPYTQELFAPTFDYPSDEEMVTIGFHLMPNLYDTSDIFESGMEESFSRMVQASFGVDQRLEEFEAVCWWGGSDRYSELQEDNRGQTGFSIEYLDLPENPENPIPAFGQLNNTVREERGLGGPTCRWVNHADTAEPKQVYRTTGTVESVNSEISTIADERGFEANSINLADDYKSTMRSDLFRDLSEEWQNEAGYERIELDCVPNDQHFQGSGMTC